MKNLVVNYLLLVTAICRGSIACQNPEKTADGTKDRHCFSDEQCSLGFSCNQALMKCCQPDTVTVKSTQPNFCKDVEKNIDGSDKTCSQDSKACSSGYRCLNGKCCGSTSTNIPVSSLPKKENMEVSVINAGSESCPLLQEMSVSACFGVNNKIRCSSQDDCQGGQLCCESTCGRVCTEPVKTLKKCEQQFKMAAIKLMTKDDICTPLFIPRCDNNGNYQRKQCLDSHGICWCVFPNGTKIADTEIRGNPDCSKASKPGRCPGASFWTMDLVDDHCMSDDDCQGPDDKCCYNGMAYQCVPPDGMLTTIRDRRSPQTGCGTSGKAMKCCDARLCLHAICPSNANAVCRIDPCNDCAVEFYDYMNRKVDDCYAGMTHCDKLRVDLMNARPSLTWMDTTNPPWLDYELSHNGPMGAIMPMWMDTTNPPILEANSFSLGAPPPGGSKGDNSQRISTLALDDVLLLQKITEDGGEKKFLQQSVPTLGTLGQFVCPAIFQLNNSGNCLQNCNRDGDCSPGKKCCFGVEGCTTCHDPVEVKSQELCKLPPVSGECISKPFVNRFYFNQVTGKCEPFLFRDGCHGNANNFLTIEACERGCIQGVPDQCISFPDPGLCYGYFPMWFYNISSGQCEQFVYGGCQGNSNRFLTENQCYLSCGNRTNIPSACQKLSCQDNSICLAYNDTFAECYLKTQLITDMKYYQPICDMKGTFYEEQCAGHVCWCVDVNSGAYVKDSIRIGSGNCSSFDSNSIGDLQKAVCLNGNSPTPCISSCRKVKCEGHPDAMCVPDPCNNCSITFLDKDHRPLTCGVDRCSSRKPSHQDHRGHGGHLGCGNPKTRYAYNPLSLKCDEFLYTTCEGPDLYFPSKYDCLEQCAGHVCAGSQPKMCENTCVSPSCESFPGALCQVDICSCAPMFFDPVTRQKVDCKAVIPVCQLKRTSVIYLHVQESKALALQYMPVCDEIGDFSPQQCALNGQQCWCVDGIGNPIRGTLKSVVNSGVNLNCERNTTKNAMVNFKFTEDYDAFVKGKEENFRKLILDAILHISSDFKDLIKTIMIRKGSIDIDVELESTSSASDMLVASHVNALESQIRKGFTVDVNGTPITAEKDDVRTVITFQPESQPQKTSKVDGEILNQNTLIIVIVVICAVLLMAFIVIAICAKKRSLRSKGGDLAHVENSKSVYYKNEACDFKDETQNRKDTDNKVEKDNL